MDTASHESSGAHLGQILSFFPWSLVDLRARVPGSSVLAAFRLRSGTPARTRYQKGCREGFFFRDSLPGQVGGAAAKHLNSLIQIGCYYYYYPSVITKLPMMAAACSRQPPALDLEKSGALLMAAARSRQPPALDLQK